MKPLHIGLLIAGAAIAGGLAVKLTQPLPTPLPQVAAVSTPAPTPATIPGPEVPPAPPTAAPVSAATPETAPETAPPARVTGLVPSPVPQPAKRSPVHSSVTSTPAPAHTQEPAPVPTATVTPPPYPGPEPPAQGRHLVEDPGPLEQPKPEPAPTAVPRKVTLRAGIEIPARLIETLSSDKVKQGDRFQATLAEPLVADGLVVAEKGARVWGRVIAGSVAGKFQGVSRLELAMESFESSDGQRVAISTIPWVKQGESPRNGEALKVGGGAALGAIIGAIAGGGKGAAIGAGAGGAAGVGAVALGQSKPVTVPTETVIRFRLASPVTITERI